MNRVCEDCSASFEHSGRGRPPKRCLPCREARGTKKARAPVVQEETPEPEVEEASQMSLFCDAPVKNNDEFTSYN